MDNLRLSGTHAFKLYKDSNLLNVLEQKLSLLYLLEIALDEILWRVPAINDVEIRQMVNGPESFTLDGHCALGEAPNVGHH